MTRELSPKAEASLDRIHARVPTLLNELYGLRKFLPAGKDVVVVDVSIRATRLLRETYIYLTSNFLQELVDDSAVDALEVELDYVAAFLEGIKPRLEEGGVQTLANDAQQLLHYLLESLEALLEPLAAEGGRLDVNVRLAETEAAIQRFNGLRLELEREQELQQALARIQSAAAAGEQAIGPAAAAALGKHYNDYAVTEEQTADKFRSWVLKTYGASVASAIGVAIWIAADDGSAWSVEILKLAVVIPFVLLSLYLSREADQHRAVARTAKEYQIRLQTLDAFIAPLSDEKKDDLRAKVGEAIFTGPTTLTPAGGEDPLNANSKALLEILSRRSSSTE